ncbi:helix-turn-helix domain-containing protein [Croceicoccus sediminis]|uniref:helix-turn-helix domain-containing protein n=1 Tax=Croceicoccus sediminis TaxID=2571150 RepID=UPI001182D2B2|nr:helix-turn-helix domain-containing protein [Croceicoccus sediminis]
MKRTLDAFEKDLNSLYASYSLEPNGRASGNFGTIVCKSHYQFEIAEIESVGLKAHRSPLPDEFQDRVHLVLCRKGRIGFGQYGRSAVLRPGDALVIDSKAECQVEVFEPSSNYTIEMRRQHLIGWRVPVASAAGRCLGANTGLVNQMNGFVSSIAHEDQKMTGRYAAELQDVLAHMLSHCLPDHDTWRAIELHERITKWARKQVGKREILPEEIAQHFGLSRRNLYRHFERMGTTPVRFLLALKAEKARDLLSSPESSRQSISTIAYICGFSDAAHFSRVFKSQFGLSPKEWRQKAL